MKNIFLLSTNYSLTFIGLCILLNLYSSAGYANENQIYQSRFSDQWQKASMAELEELRGGFSLGNGIVIDFSFEKIIYRNGVETFYSFFEVPKDIPLVQNGTLNFAADFTNAMLNSVIQNNLDNQVIRTVNTINIDIRNLKNFNIRSIESFKGLMLRSYQ